MIRITDLNILEDLPDKSILLCVSNCEGLAETGAAAEYRKKYPQWYLNYKEYCNWFKYDYSELLGSFHSFSQNENLKICSIFAIDSVTKARPATNFKCIENALRRIERQTRCVNSAVKTNWTLHVWKTDEGFFGDWQRFYALLEYFFKESPVELWIHERK